LIKITEEYSDQDKNRLQKIKVTTDNKQERTFATYPIVIMSKDLEYIVYEAQKKQGHGKNEDEHKHKNVGVLEKAKEKALELKDSVVDNTRQLTHEQNS
jgi:hypothetical protein